MPDVERAELDVLVGAERLIERCNPDIITEILLEGDRVPDSVTGLANHGYRIFDPTPCGPVPIVHEALHNQSSMRRSATARYGEMPASARTGPEDHHPHPAHHRRCLAR